MSAAAEPRILFGSSEGELYLQFAGTATSRVCPSAEKLVSAFLATQKDAPRVVVDVRGCQWIDSTFAGWLVGLLRRTRSSGGALVIARCGDECRKSFATMGLTKLLEFQDAPTPRALRDVACPELAKNDPGTLHLLLAAHEELAALDETNRRVFGPIVAMLRKESEQKGLPAS